MADDEVFAQYREAGVLMYRGFTLQNFADQVCVRVCVCVCMVVY